LRLFTSAAIALMVTLFTPSALSQPKVAGAAEVRTTFAALEAEIAPKLDDAGRARLHRGLGQVASLWRAEDGSPDEAAQFVRAQFATDAAALDALFGRFEANFEQIDGRLLKLGRELRSPIDLDTGPLLPVDPLFGGYDPGGHVAEDFFANKIAFAALLNFPLTTLAERESLGPSWTRRQWAEARLASRFSKRIPAEVDAGITRAISDAELYINGYNLWMNHVLDEDGSRLFPKDMRLLSHWNLRDEIKAAYAEPNGLRKQRVILRAMERIVDQSIPRNVVDNPAVDWNPWTNAISPNAPAQADTRYAKLLAIFRASRKADPFSPAAPTMIARRFDDDYEIPVERVRAILREVIASPLVPRVAGLVAKRLGRPLEPFDLWYGGFRSSGKIAESRLDEIVRTRYPDAAAFERDIPRMLRRLGFDAEQAKFLAANIVVDPARGSGHAAGAAMRSEKAHLRTRVGKAGMDYKGYNIGVHEMGHNVEQVFSLNRIDHTLLQGVPNGAFTEALAFVFQARDLELLELGEAARVDESMKTLSDFWATYEIAGVALVDIGAWEWMYAHPDATAGELRDAVVAIARQVWNEGYAPVFGKRDATLLAIYSHMLNYPLYLANYPLGHTIAFQVEEQMRKGRDFGAEFERVARLGRLTPDEWMRRATGSAVSPEALLRATGKALETTSAR